MKRKNKKNVFLNAAKSPYFFVVSALVLATAAIIGYHTFASGVWIPTPCLGGTIRMGSAGSCVVAAKKALNYICQNRDLRTTDLFDLPMYYRVIGFQSSARIVPDGVIGRTTWSNIYHYNYYHAPGSLGCFERHIDNP